MFWCQDISEQTQVGNLQILQIILFPTLNPELARFQISQAKTSS